MADEKTRYALIIWEVLHILRDAAEPKQASEMVVLVGSRIQPTPHESERLKGGGSRWETSLGFVSGDAVTVGWMSKLGGWTITEAGIEAL